MTHNCSIVSGLGIQWFFLSALATSGLCTGSWTRSTLGDEPDITDAVVHEAIHHGIAWLKAQRNQEGHWEQHATPDDMDWAGDSALAVLALLYAGENPRTEFISSALNWLEDQTLQGTYTYGVRAHALALVPGAKYRRRLKADLDWLLENVYPRNSEHPGCYDYRGRPGGRENGRWDNSVSQFGVLGAWMATDAGLSVPAYYWETVGQHWMTHQQSDGGWCYQARGRSTGSMTAAGLATLFVVLDRVYGSRPREAVDLIASIEQGLDWLGREYSPQNSHGDRRWLYYYLYGVERVGRASGYKYFRNKDWFREGAMFLLDKQKQAGNWPGSGEGMNDLRNTCFALMFLCHGRAPLLFNKLEHGTDWNYTLRDVAGITHYAEQTLERLLNWQIVSLDVSMDDLLEAPVLYLRGESACEFNEVQVRKIREYCQRGGMLLAVAGRQSQEFSESIRQLAVTAFPDYQMRQLTSDHPLFNGEVQFEIKQPPPMFAVHNGVRLLMLICSEDIAKTWSRQGGRREHFHLGCNIYNYATDKTHIRSRLVSSNIVSRPVDTKRDLEVALIEYDGQWNIEPYGWKRLRNYLNNEIGTRLLLTSGIRFDSPALDDFKIAYMTGIAAFKLSAEEQKGLRRFLSNGGTLLADAAGGARDFSKSFETHLTGALKSNPTRLSKDSFLWTGQDIPAAVNLSGVTYTRSARGRVRDQVPPLWTYRTGHRLAVIYSPLDISAGLLGKPIYGRLGYADDGPLLIMRNLLLYADLPTREKARLLRQ